MAQYYRDLNDFLRKHKTTDNSTITHTRIGNRGNIFPGKYSIPKDELPTLYKLYHKHVFIEENKEYLTEKQVKNDCAPLLVDLDFRYSTEVNERPHTQEHIEDLVGLYADVMIKACKNLKDFSVYILEKPHINTKVENSVKDGIHLVFNVGCDHITQQIIREGVKEQIGDVLDDLNLTNSYSDVLDEGISKGTTNWQMFGSRKPDNEAYELTGKYTFTVDDNGFTQEREDIEDITRLDLLSKLSPHNVSNQAVTASDELKKVFNEMFDKSKRNKKIHYRPAGGEADVNITDEDKELADIISLKYIDNYSHWIKLIWSCVETNNFELAHYISKRGDKYDGDETATRAIYEMGNPKDEGLSKGSFYHYCKISNPEEYAKIRNKYKKSSKLPLITHALIANKFVEAFGTEFIYSNEKVFFWNGDVWDSNGAKSKASQYIQNQLYNILHTDVMSNVELYGDDLAKTLGSLAKLQDRTFRDKTYKDIVDCLVLDRKDDLIFNFHPSQKKNIHFKNGVLMLDKITSHKSIMADAFRPREKSDYMTGYNDYDFEVPDKSLILEIENLYKKIQPKEEIFQYFLTYLAYCLTADTQEQKCEFDIGYTASNGKSTHLDIHQKAMPFYSQKLAKNTFDENNSKSHKQLIKLFEKPIRLAYMEEINTKKIDAELFKDFVDGKELNVEIMYGTCMTQQHQAKLKICGNHDVNVNGDAGVLRRGIKCDFKSKFVKTTEDNPKRNIYKVDLKLADKFNTDTYKSAYICMLIPFLIRYLESGLVVPPVLENAFKNMVEEFDSLKTWLEDNIEECDADDIEANERVSKKELLHKIECAGFKNGWKTILPRMKQLGFEYENRLNCGMKDKKQIRGGFSGCMWVS